MNRKLYKQQGVSLVGLMVASTIGLFIIGAALKMYTSSQTTFQARQALATAAENSRFAIADMRRMIVMAGRGMEGTAGNDKDIHQTFTSLSSPSGQILTNSTGTGINGSDVIHFRVAQGVDCFGNKITTQTITVPGSADKTIGTVTRIRYYVQNNGGINDLMCEVSDDVSLNQQVLVSGIEMLKFLYGIDNNDDNSADQYLTADEVNALMTTPAPGNPNIWEELVAVRIGVVASSGDVTIPFNRRLPAAPGPINLLSGVYTPPDSARAYRTNTVTVALRNLKIQ